MELPANLAVSDGGARALQSFRPGVVRWDDDGLAFVERGTETLESLATVEIASVSISTHLFGADDLDVVTRQGSVWSFKVKGAAQIVETLRARGVQVNP